MWRVREEHGQTVAEIIIYSVLAGQNLFSLSFSSASDHCQAAELAAVEKNAMKLCRRLDTRCTPE